MSILNRLVVSLGLVLLGACGGASTKSTDAGTGRTTAASTELCGSTPSNGAISLTAQGKAYDFLCWSGALNNTDATMGGFQGTGGTIGSTWRSSTTSPIQIAQISVVLRNETTDAIPLQCPQVPVPNETGVTAFGGQYVTGQVMGLSDPCLSISASYVSNGQTVWTALAGDLISSSDPMQPTGTLTIDQWPSYNGQPLQVSFSSDAALVLEPAGSAAGSVEALVPVTSASDSNFSACSGACVAADVGYYIQ